MKYGPPSEEASEARGRGTQPGNVVGMRNRSKTLCETEGELPLRAERGVVNWTTGVGRRRKTSGLFIGWHAVMGLIVHQPRFSRHQFRFWSVRPSYILLKCL